MTGIDHLPFERWAAIEFVRNIDPRWAELYAESPVAYQPHKQYWNCCELPAEHMIHDRSVVEAFAV